MTISELIAKLQTYPGDIDVFAENFSTGDLFPPVVQEYKKDCEAESHFIVISPDVEDGV